MTARPPAASSRLSTLLQTHGLTLGLAVLLFYLLMRNSGLMPTMFADELYYSTGSRLLAPGESTLPVHLYFALYRFTSQCGTGFLDCARLFNSVLYVGAAPFLYLIARRVCSRAVAGIVVLMSLLAPASLYTAFFIPEPLYFTLFCVFAWAALRWRAAPPLLYGALTGGMLGLMMLVKPHAMFLLPALMAFMAYLAWAGAPGATRWRNGVLMLAAAPVAMLAVRLGVGVLLAGRPGLSLLGHFYGSVAGDTGPGALAKLVPTALGSLYMHTLAIALLFTVPAAALLLHASDRGLRQAQNSELRALQVFTVLMLGAAVALTVMFTAKLGMINPPELTRVHQRYYDFVFPLLLIIGAAALADQASVHVALFKRVLVALVVGLLVLAGARFYLFGSFVTIPVDSPELWGFLLDRGITRALLVLMLVVLGLWCWRRRLGARLFTFVLLPCMLWQGQAGVHRVLANARVPIADDRSAQAVKNFLDKEDLAHLTLVGENVGMQRAKFELDDSRIMYMELKPGQPLRTEEMAPNQWMLVVGDHGLPEGIVPTLKTKDYALVRLPGSYKAERQVDFVGEMPGPVLSEATGMAGTEPPWGRWSIAPQVQLTVKQPLPKALGLVLTAYAFGPNAGQEMTITVGKEKRSFRLSELTEQRYFTFDTDGSETKITIDVLHPKTPREIGMAPDDRQLGLRMTRLEIGSRP